MEGGVEDGSKLGRTRTSTLSSEAKRLLAYFSISFLVFTLVEMSPLSTGANDPAHFRPGTTQLGQKHTFQTPSSAHHLQLKLKNSTPGHCTPLGSVTPPPECKEATLQMQVLHPLTLYQEIGGTCE